MAIKKMLNHIKGYRRFFGCVLVCLIFIAFAGFAQATELAVGLAPVKVNALENRDYYAGVVKDKISLRLGIPVTEIPLQPGDFNAADLFQSNEKLSHIIRALVAVAGEKITVDFLLYARSDPASPAPYSMIADSLEEFLPKLDIAITDLKEGITVKRAVAPAPNAEVVAPKLKMEAAAGKLAKEVIVELKGRLTSLVPLKLRDREVLALVLNREVKMLDLDSDSIIEDVFYEGSNIDNFVSAFSVDIDNDGNEELWINNFQEQRLSSVALKVEDNRFKPVIEKSGWFLRKTETEKGLGVIGQPVNRHGKFIAGIYHVSFVDREVKKGPSIEMPSRNMNVLQYNLIDLNGDGNKEHFYLSVTGHMMVIDKEGKTVARSVSDYGGSMVFYNIPGSLNKKEETVYIDKPPIALDLNGDRKDEILVIRNVSSMPFQLSRIRSFKNGELILASFDGYDFEDKEIYSLPGCVHDYYIRPGADRPQDKLYLAQISAKIILGSPVSRLVVIRNFW